MIAVTSAKFGAKIDSRALNSRLDSTSFVLPSTLSGKFAFSRFYFPQLMFYILTEAASVFPLSVLNLEAGGLFS